MKRGDLWRDGAVIVRDGKRIPLHDAGDLVEGDVLETPPAPFLMWPIETWREGFGLQVGRLVLTVGRFQLIGPRHNSAPRGYCIGFRGLRIGRLSIGWEGFLPMGDPRGGIIVE